MNIIVFKYNQKLGICISHGNNTNIMLHFVNNITVAMLLHFSGTVFA